MIQAELPFVKFAEKESAEKIDDPPKLFYCSHCKQHLYCSQVYIAQDCTQYYQVRDWHKDNDKMIYTHEHYEIEYGESYMRCNKCDDEVELADDWDYEIG